MAEIVLPGPVSGRRYGFKIAGDAPTVDEQLRIDSRIRQYEDQFAEGFAAQYGQRPAGAEAGILDYLGEFPKGIARGAVGFGETAALGAASLLPEQYETPTRDAIRGGAYALKPQVDIGLEDTVSGKFGEAVGSFVPLAVASVIPGGQFIAPALAIGAGAGEASERARTAGATEQERGQALIPGAIVGAAELLPIKFIRALGRGDAMGMTQRLGRIAATGGVEGVQEAATQVAQNLISQGIYNPDQGTFSGTGESLGYGAGVGGLVQALVDLAIPGRKRGAPPRQVPPPVAAEPNTIDGVTSPAADGSQMEFDFGQDPNRPAPSARYDDDLGPGPGVEPASAEDIAAVSQMDFDFSPEPVRTAAPAPTAAPVATPVGVTTTDTLDTLGVPKTAPIYKAVKNKTLAGNDLANRLEQYAQAIVQAGDPKFLDSATRTLDYVRALRTDQAKAAVAPAPTPTRTTPLDVPTPAPTTVSETAPTPKTAMSSAPSKVAKSAAPKVDTLLADARGRLAERTAVADKIATAGKPVVMENPAGMRVLVGPNTIAGEKPFRVTYMGADGKPSGHVEAATLRDAAVRAMEDRFMPAATPTTTAAAEPAPVQAEMDFAPSPEPAPAAAAQAAPEVTPTPAAAAVPTPVQTEPATLPTVTREPEYAPMTGATPGQPLGTAGQVIPAPVAPPVRPTPAMPATTTVTREAPIPSMEAGDRALANRIAEWFMGNATAALKSQTFALVADVETAPTTAADKSAVLNLLASKPKKSRAAMSPEYAAYAYFSKTPDPGTALHDIAHDLAAVGETSVPKFRSRANIMQGEKVVTPQLQADIDFYVDTGTEPALRAARWIKDNLSPETVAQVLELQGTYRPISFEAAAESRDARKAAQATMADETADQVLSYSNDPEGKRKEAQLRLAQLREAQSAIPKDMRLKAVSPAWQPLNVGGTVLHPRVVAYLRAGDLVGALRNLAATTPNVYARDLATTLAARLPATPVQILSEVEMARIRDITSPEMRTFGVAAPAGVFIPRGTPAQIAKKRAENPDAADVYEQYGGQVLINETGGLDVTTLLHEVSHAVTDGVLTNTAHPLTRQMDNLRELLLTFMPESTYGLYNVRELLAEGMTNREFRRDLSLVNPGASAFSAWDMFKHNMNNFLRNLVGLRKKELGSAQDAFDRVAAAVLASSPSERGAGDVLASSFRPGGAASVLKGFSDRISVPTETDIDTLKAQLRNVSIPASWKDTMIWATMPLDYVADAAKKYFPTTARRIHDLVLEHAREKQVLIERVTQTTKEISAWVKNNAAKVDDFNEVRFVATLNEVDPRKSRAAYEGYSYKYKVLDATGAVSRTVESAKYKTETLRNNAMQAHNRTQVPNTAKAVRSFDEGTDQLAAYDRIQPMYRGLGPEGRSALARAFELPTNLSADLAQVLKDRLDALLPGNKSMQERIYGQIYDKVFAGKLIDPYQALQRRGDYWLSYEARDPKTGDLELFKHSFVSESERRVAIQLLEQQPAEVGVAKLSPYQQKAGRARERVPMQFISQVLNAVEGAEGLDTSVRAQIIELVFDAAPETSFINAFRKRKGVRGFVGDITPLTSGLTPGDTMTNIQSNGLKIAQNIADLKYGAKFSQARNAIEAENVVLQEGSITADPLQAAQDRAEAASYANALTAYTETAFKTRGTVARNLTGAAYALTLGFNVSTALITLMQIPMFVAPFLAGRHGMRSTSQALGIASRILTGTGRERTVERVGETGETETLRTEVGWYDFSIDNLDFTAVDSPFGYLAELQDIGRINGVFNRSLIQDILQGEGTTGASGAWQNLMAKSGIFQHHAERATRETTMIASYLLGLKEMAKKTNMGDYSVKQLTAKLQDGSLQFTSAQMRTAAIDAVNTAEKTNGSMYAATAPLASQSDLGSIMYLFKRHPLSMYNLLYQTVKRSLPSNASLEDKRIARFQLAGMMGMVGLTAGALGLPLVQQIGWMYDLFADDDEEDFETVVRTTLGEFGSFGIVDYLTGLRISERVGLSGSFYRPGFNADNLPLMYQVAEGLGGPVVGLGLKYTDRVPKLLADGEIQRATEAMIPTAVGNALRAIRFANEGIRTTRGDPIVGDVGPFGATAQFFGFMPANYAQQLDINAAGSRIDNAINQKRTTLLRKRYVAMAQGDSRSVQDIDRDIAEFNQRHPYNQITDDTKKKSLKSHKDTTSRMHHGVQFSEKNLSRIMQTVNDFGPASIFD